MAALEAEVKMRLNPPNPVLGEEVRITVEIENEPQGAISVANWPQCAGLEMDWQHHSMENYFENINGNTRQGKRLVFGGRAVKQGVFDLTPMHLKIFVLPVQSNGLKVRVGMAQSGGFFQVQSRLLPAEGYAGQVFRLEVDVLVADQEVARVERLAGGTYELAANHYDGLRIPPELEQDFLVTPLESRRANPQSPELFGKPVGEVESGGFSYRVQRIVLSLYPRRPGRFTLPAFTVVFHRLQPVRNFFNVQLQHAGAPFTATSEPLLLNAAEPPAAGRPASFTGAVCEKIEAVLTPEDLKPGGNAELHAPISVSLKLSSDLPPEYLRLPPWTAQERLCVDFEVSANAAVRENSENEALFKEILLRPLKTSITEIPALEFSWFHPVERVYKTARTQSFSLHVEGTKSSPTAAGSPVLPRVTEEPQAVPASLAGLEPSPSLVLDVRDHENRGLWVGLLALLPWCALGLRALIPAWRHWRGRRAARQQASLAYTLRALKTAQDPESRLRLFRDFLARYGSENSGQNNSSASGLGDEIADALQRLEAAAYGGGSAAVPAPEELAALLRRFEQSGS